MDLTYGAARISQTGRTQQIRYQEFSHQERKTGPCPVCGKRRARSRTFTATQSPFNTDPVTGQPRTPQQIQQALAAEGSAWAPDFSCADHDPAEVCAVVGHTPGQYTATRCSYCRQNIPGPPG